jgi:transcription antitermination factor NusG
MTNWYALQVRSQCEGIVAFHLAAAGVEGFYPHAIAPSKHARRATEIKFFPGYVFGRFDLLEKTPVVAIPKVVSILGFGAHAAPIPDSEIDAVKLIVSFPELVMPCPYVNAGDKVRVTRGPLRGLEGFVCYSKSHARVIVSVAMIAQSISAEVDAGSLELIERAELVA